MCSSSFCIKCIRTFKFLLLLNSKQKIFCRFVDDETGVDEGLKPKTCKIKKECQICDFGWGWAFSTAISKNWPVNLNVWTPRPQNCMRTRYFESFERSSATFGAIVDKHSSCAHSNSVVCSLAGRTHRRCGLQRVSYKKSQENAFSINFRILDHVRFCEKKKFFL